MTVSQTFTVSLVLQQLVSFSDFAKWGGIWRLTQLKSWHVTHTTFRG